MGLATFWVSGLPGAGKSTVCRSCEWSLVQQGYQTVTVDGDLWREARAATTIADYSDAGREKNVEELAGFCTRLNHLGYTVLVATCSPLASLRDMAAGIIPRMYEIELAVDVDICRARQPDLYAKADDGIFQSYPGVHLPFESRRTAFKVDASLDISEVTRLCMAHILERLY